MHWPQYTMLALMVAGLAIAFVEHGAPRKPLNFWVTLFASGVSFWLLWAGGFFRQP